MALSVKVLGRGWRPALEALVLKTKEQFTLSSPYIKANEARWLVERLPERARLSVLTNVSTQSIGDESLDLAALGTFLQTGRARVVTLPRLHAKVFIADTEAAIVTSGNLTTSGLNANFEYGAQFTREPLVATIRQDLARYSELGSDIDAEHLPRLIEAGDRLIEERRRLDASASREARSAFRESLRAARQTFVSAQVGKRTANELFAVAIRLVLESGPRSTADLGAQVQSLLPELCDDSDELIINGERFGKAWKHRLRNAQQYLKRRGEVTYDPTIREWALTN